MQHDSDLGFDLAAASLRADEREIKRAVDTLAAKLEGALPSACRVKRRRRALIFGQARVVAIDVALGDMHLVLKPSRRRLTAVRVQHIHDMSRRTEIIDVAEWLRSLERALRARAASSAEARAALERLLEA